MRRWAGLLASVLVAAHAGDASAQTVEIAPVGGYRVGGDLFERVTGQAVDLDGAPAVGAILNVAMGGGLFFEGFFTHQEARVDVPATALAPPTRWHITVEHWLAGGLREFREGRARPFLTGLLGLTRYAAEGDNEIRFAVSAGGGVKLQPARRLGVRLDGRVFTTFVDVDGRAVACTPGFCIGAFHFDVVWQAEVTAGLFFVF